MVNPPSVKSFNLSLFVLAKTTVFFTLFYVNLRIIWLFNLPSWGDFEEHQAYIFDAIWLVLPFRDANDWHLYIRTLESTNNLVCNGLIIQDTLLEVL